MSTSIKTRLQGVKRGDTIIEVMMAIAIFCMVAILSITMMNLGTNNAQSALELAIARNEINAQAEALRFVHSAYISEKTLPVEPQESSTDWNYDDYNNRYQQYKGLWEEIVGNALDPDTAQNSGLLNLSELLNNSNQNDKFKTYGCERVYEEDENQQNWLEKNKAFILNARNLNKLERDASGKLIGTDVDYSYIKAGTEVSGDQVFQAAPLNARVIYRLSDEELTNTNPEDNNSTSQITDNTDKLYDQVYRAEGIWVIAVKESADQPRYYDFYIESCWYGPNTTSPSTIDTVIRLYNPENV